MNYFFAHDADREAVLDQQALADWRLDVVQEHHLDRCYQEYCDRYHVSLGICMDGEEFPRCELGRTIRNNGGER